MHSQCKQKTLGRARIDIGERGEAIVMGWYSRYRIVWIRAFVGARGGRRGGEKTSSLCHRCQELCFSNFQRSCKVKLQRVTAAYGDGMCRGLNLGSSTSTSSVREPCRHRSCGSLCTDAPASSSHGQATTTSQQLPAQLPPSPIVFVARGQTALSTSVFCIV
jgi:hypothetical protein